MDRFYRQYDKDEFCRVKYVLYFITEAVLLYMQRVTRCLEKSPFFAIFFIVTNCLVLPYSLL